MGWVLLGSFVLPIGLAVANENPIVPDAAAANAAVARAEEALRKARGALQDSDTQRGQLSRRACAETVRARDR